MKLLYYLAAIGSKNLEIKHKILFHNLNYIYKNIREKFSVSINFYDICEEIKENIKKLDFLENVYIYEKKGVLTELFLTSPANNHINSYDYILFVLDDVKITTIDIQEMIKIKEKYKLDILSPRITNSSHCWMNSIKKLTINNFLEVYFLLLNPENFYKFCSLHTVENKWMWGVDMLFGYYNMNVGVIHIYEANHELPSNANCEDAKRLMNVYLKTRTKFSNFFEIGKEFKAIREQLDID